MNNLQKFIKTQILAAHLYDGPLPKSAKDWIKNEGIPAGDAIMAQYKVPAAARKQWAAAAGKLAKGAKHEDIVDDFAEIAGATKAILPKIHKDTSVHINDLKTLRDIALVNHKGSDAAWLRLTKDIGRLKDPDLNAITPVNVEKPEPYVRAMKKAWKTLTGKDGKDGMTMTPDESAAHKAKNPEAHAAFLKARRAYTQIGKEALRAHVRSTGDHLIDAHDAVKHLTSNGYSHNVPKGFVGKLDENGRLHTVHGEAIAGGVNGEVKMNPDYKKGGKMNVFTGRPFGSQQDQYYFTVAAKAHAAVSKQKKVSALTDKIGEIRKKWTKHLDGGANDKTALMAAMLETSYQTQTRIGNKGNKTDGEETFGLSTLQPKHIKIEGNKVTISYKGKSGQSQKHVMVGEDAASKKAIAIIKELKERAASPTSDLWTIGKKRVDSRSVNEYFTKELGSPTTNHALRSMKGNLIMREELAKRPKTSDEKKVVDFLNKALLKVGKQLGHFNKGEITPNTALQSYVDPQIIDDYFGHYKEHGIRPPAKMQAVIDKLRQAEGIPVNVEHHGTTDSTPDEPASTPKKAAPSKPDKVQTIKKLPAVQKLQKKLPPAKAPEPSLYQAPVAAPAWFKAMTGKEQREYLKEHPNSKLKPTKV